ncbi:DUF3300 domain-containing protein [Paraglaciecola aquimarina]|uniref:DUF3300 domain-containing protein n=1 Tax=Paraglaciecola algarum TaxID=3050085 RepID=A0ABS9DBY3_9ALTE|nr:DUF3300 domain-containing protein [Paraglaciecola sp. G1-23]MCF2949537.1 DUF3300 domain-containing protein [Paraglaciecola sp. G1-23]
MRNQAKYLLIYLCVVCFLVGSVVNLAQAQELNQKQDTNTTQNNQETLLVDISQAELDQLLAPIALYPDTLLSHIFVASTYPLEVVQAARWRRNNKDLDEQEALNAVEKKDWDPSVKALVPFHDLLQTLSDDLDWLQSLGNAFLFAEERVLDSVQTLRQKAYAQGNLHDNEYLEVEQDGDEIVIQTVEKEVVYIPYYDTRHVYGNWWWNDHPPYYWHSPSHYILSAGIYWSSRFYIRPSFYFSGFHWHKRHLVADYTYNRHSNNHYWAPHHSRKQKVRITEYSRWKHNKHHRRGVQYKHNGQRVIRNTENPKRYVSSTNQPHSKKQHQIDKQRVLDVSRYPKAHPKLERRSSAQVKNQLQRHSKTTKFDKNTHQSNKTANYTKKPTSHKTNELKSVNQYKRPLSHKSKDYRPANQQEKSRDSYNRPTSYASKPERAKPQRQSSSYKHQQTQQRSKPSYQNKSRQSGNSSSNRSRPVKIERHSKIREKR